MAELTLALLEKFTLSNYAGPSTIQRGTAYFREGRVWDIEFVKPDHAVCEVEGATGDYTVEIAYIARSGGLAFGCTCEYSRTAFCKHMVAAMLTLRHHLKTHSSDNKTGPAGQGGQWKRRLETALSAAPRSTAAGSQVQRFAAFLTLQKVEYYNSVGYSFVPYLVKAKNWPALSEMVRAGPEAVHELLDRDLSWMKSGEMFSAQTNPAGCINLNPEGFSLLALLFDATRYGWGVRNVPEHLESVAALQIPLFLVNTYKKSAHGRVRIYPNPADITISFSQSRGSILLQANLDGRKLEEAEVNKAVMISQKPPWLLVERNLIRLYDTRQAAMLSAFPVVVPESEAAFFREHYLRRIAETFPLTGDLLRWRDVHAEPQPRLYLQDDQGSSLRAEMRFGYADFELAAAKGAEPVSVETVPDSWELARIHRNPEREQEFHQLLTDPAYRLKRGGENQPFGTYELRARAHPYDFLMHSVPLLTAAGFEIFGEDRLKVGKANRATPSLRVHISSGIDWFDLNALVAFGEQEVPFLDVRKALKRGERYIKLADGSVGQLPEEWLEKYRHLWDMAQETEQGLRVSDFHLPLLDTLLDEGVVDQIPADLAERRERLRGFEQIASRPLPQGFVGELRPYQVHGFEWLHFLREFKFGGILADDMGLGKTVQMLAYLQSLKETQSGPRQASLLVVPKSLLTNWQREAEKFTPGLHFLEYTGIQRRKETDAFAAYDVIVTTYGTMLRDIEILRQYPFDHVVLDESQAIKNPLSKSAKATRLLQAGQRLAMTGTPVENSTFELWSQFAFINPGLLGGLEYFRREFANPIEGGKDEETAAVLRRLVYPFILRRTKDQVAPELPPRTERIMYTDLDPAQKRLYVQTRERYRAELMGLIESEGMNDARFKVLEGLLRLRQIAIHPALVDPAYRGEAPKFEFLLETLETLRAEGHKALIFSQFVETLKLLRAELDAHKISYTYLDGRTRDRQARVDLFQNDPAVLFFLISLKAGGVGLNLTAADYVIHLDPWWNPAVEMQASDRAHRIGQDKPVFIYKIIARDTVEEKILALQEQKRALVRSLIADEAGFFKSLTQEDVRVLFE